MRVPEERRNLAYFAKVANGLAECPGIDSVDANALTASLLIFHQTTDYTIGEHASAHGLFQMEVTRPPADATAASQRWLNALSGASKHISEASDGHGDLSSMLAMMFLVLFVFQLARGQVAVPAVTALWYAIEALSLGKHWRSEPDQRQ